MSEKKEYIERGELMRNLKFPTKEELTKAFTEMETDAQPVDVLVDTMFTQSRAYLETVTKAPAADVEPVVRCGNCEHSAINEYADDIDESPYYCFHLDCGVETNGYCSSGKKRAHMERSGSGE